MEDGFFELSCFFIWEWFFFFVGFLGFLLEIEFVWLKVVCEKLDEVINKW